MLLRDILYVQAFGNYCKIFTLAEMVLVSEKISVIETQLDKRYFLRVHKSYIVSLKQIDEVSGNLLRIAKNAIPISLTYRNDLSLKLGLK